MKSLVVYFSAYGSTKKFAKEIAKQTGSDIKRIEPVIEYDGNTAHYEELAQYAKKEHDENMRPEIKNLNADTLKTVIPFCTSYSSGVGQSDKLLKNEAKGGEWKSGQRFYQDVDLSEVDKWTNGLGL